MYYGQELLVQIKQLEERMDKYELRINELEKLVGKKSGKKAT